MTHPAIRFVPALALVAAAAGLSSQASAAPAPADRIRTEGELIRYPVVDTAGQSITLPEGARARVQAVYSAAGSTVVTLHAWGLAPGTEYGAHAHVNPCGSTGSAAGPHFQHVVDPVSPSTDPAYANPTNEIWLDFTTDEAGNGVAQTTVPWQFDETRRAASVIIHEHHTHTGSANSGVAGARLACLSVDF